MLLERPNYDVAGLQQAAGRWSSEETSSPTAKWGPVLRADTWATSFLPAFGTLRHRVANETFVHSGVGTHCTPLLQPKCCHPNEIGGNKYPRVSERTKFSAVVSHVRHSHTTTLQGFWVTLRSSCRQYTHRELTVQHVIIEDHHKKNAEKNHRR